MKTCETCGLKFVGDACPRCPLDISFDNADNSVWDDCSAEAMIIGELSDDDFEPSITSGIQHLENGQLAPILYYGTGSLEEMLELGAVPVPAAAPIEDPIAGFVDGTRTVQELIEAEGRPKDEVIAALIALLESGAIYLRPADAAETQTMREQKLEALPPEFLKAIDEHRAMVEKKPEPPPPPPPKLPKLPKLPPPIQPLPKQPPPPPLPQRSPSRVSDENPKAAELFALAKELHGSGDHTGARNNLMLAIAFDRQRVEYRRLLETVTRELERQVKGSENVSAKVNALFEQAARQEALNDVDKAIDLLEQAIAIRKDARCFNRLGVIYAMRKKEIEVGKDMLQKAVDLDPHNRTYKHNLDKLLRARPTGEHPAPKGLLDRFRKKK